MEYGKCLETGETTKSLEYDMETTISHVWSKNVTCLMHGAKRPFRCLDFLFFSSKSQNYQSKKEGSGQGKV